MNAECLFGPNEDHEVIPGETIVESMDRQTGGSQNLSTQDVPKPEQVQKPESKKEKVSSSEGTEQHPNIPHPQGVDNSPVKRTGEDLVIPGSTYHDKKEPQPKSALPNSANCPSDGDAPELPEPEFITMV